MIKLISVFIIIHLFQQFIPIPAINYFRHANEQYDSGNYERALFYYGKIIDDSNFGKQACYNAGNAAYIKETYQEAMDYFEKAIQKDAEDEDTWHNFELARKKVLHEKSEKNMEKKSESTGSKKSYDSLSDKLLGRAAAEERRYQPFINQQSKRKKQGSFSNDIFNLPPEQLFEYIKQQTQAGYPFKPGTSLKKTKQEENIDW